MGGEVTPAGQGGKEREKTDCLFHVSATGNWKEAFSLLTLPPNPAAQTSPPPKVLRGRS